MPDNGRIPDSANAARIVIVLRMGRKELTAPTAKDMNAVAALALKTENPIAAVLATHAWANTFGAFQSIDPLAALAHVADTVTTVRDSGRRDLFADFVERKYAETAPGF